MVTIIKGEFNEFVMTLKENATFVNPEYLFVLLDKQDRPTVKFFLSDISSTDSYQLFQLEEGVDETIGEGDYHYRVYEKENQDDEDIPDNSYILEEGIWRVIGDDIDEYSYDTTKTSVVYDTTGS